MIPIILVIALVATIYSLIHHKYQYWKKRGVPGPEPTFLIGNMGKSVIFQTSPGELYTEYYNQFKDEEIVGIYRMTSPVVIVRDPELIKEVTVRSFACFHDTDIYVDKKVDPIVGKNPLFLKGEEWRIVRQQLTPGFSSGKIKWMYPLLEDVGKNLLKFMENQPDMTNGKGYEAKELCARFTLDNVVSCAFGFEGQALADKDSEFRQIAKDIFTPGGWSIAILAAGILYPQITKVLTPRLTHKETEQRLVNLVAQTVKYREENNIVRNDFFHILMQLKKNSKEYEFTDMDLVAHAAGFLGDGYETSAGVMSFVLFEMALHPQAQEKLREEVSNAFAKNDNKLPYDVLQELQYLDAVVQETLRLFPPFQHLQKLCTKDFTFTPKGSSKPLTIEKGTSAILPVYGLHHDPNYFEDPDAYKPERFLGANKENIRKCTFIPFGEGPRRCLGQRFGILQIKVGVAQIVRNYELSVNRKTQLPLKFVAASPTTCPVGGLWLDFKKLN